jgi:multidrug efflux pump subunit AcrA (membrane-fusion protein)
MHNDKNIFPAEIAEYSAEYHFQQNHTNTLIIYQIVLSAIVVIFISLFIIRVDVSVNSAGIVRPIGERDEVKSPVSGRVDSVFIKENQHVKAGQVLIKIKSEILQNQNSLVVSQQQELENERDDLNKLVSMGKATSLDTFPTLKSSLYSSQFKLYWSKVKQLQAQYAAASRQFNRYQYLYKNHVLSAAEYDKVRLDYETAKNELQLGFDGQRTDWQADLTNLKIKLQQLNTQENDYDQQKDFYSLKASVSGTVQEFKGLQPGAFVAANDVVAEVSPDSGMIAESYVSPKDIGLIRVGTRGSFQVDAFDYNEWGMIKGKIISISSDISTTNGQPYFKVKCKLEANALKLKNGIRGNLKKGMTLQARFYVTRRSLFQLLHDKTDDWLNPNVLSNNKKTIAAEDGK